MKSWNPRAVLAGMLLVVLSTGVRVGAGAAPTWPEPPRQRSPWTPPATSLPPALLAATATLFEQGLADPRGCEYRAIEVMAGSSTNGSAQPLRTHGWVLPATGAGPRFAVCWDGLVYPALSVGAAADLRADVTTGVERIDREKKGGLGTGYRHWSMGAANGLASDSANPLQMCLLLRLGEERLAQRVWSVWQPQASDQGPYLELASDWLWYLFDRTVSAHARGDDALALASARQLAPATAAVETEAARQGFKRPVRYVGRVAEPAPYVDFGTDPQELLRDQERRSRPAGQRDARIAARIRALEEVAERQRMQPGSPFLSNSPLVRALIREGDRAVSPLIDCLEHDSRLTRSVHYSRNFQRHREVLPVRSAAYAALSGILKTSSFGPEPRAGRSWAKTAAQVRAYWQQNQGRTQAERWYRTLRDDQAGPEGWLEAAGHLTFPVFPKSEPEVTSPQHPAFGTIGSRRTLPLQGEALRNRTEPSVSAVLEQRVTELSAGPPDSTRIAAAVELALYLSTWDPKAAVPTLRRLFHRCEQLYPSGKPDAPAGFDPEFVATRLSRLTLARVRGKDADALPDYTHWMLAAEPKTDGRGIFEPLWTYPNDPAVRTAASILFNAPGSRWREEVEKQAGSSVVSQDFVHSPLLGVTAFRVLLYRLLADRSPAGTARLDRKGGLGITTPVSSIGSSGGQYLDDPRGARPETTVRFRKCDFVAATLSQIGGAPEFELFWREEARDAALPRVVQFLRRYGPRLAYADVQIHVAGPNLSTQGALTFPQLGGPATRADVQQTRAIFSLAGQGRVRHVKLPAHPMCAVRSVSRGGTAAGDARDGWVWQAEEVLVRGKWQRFYGFVGPHEVMKVPAAEIEFPSAEPRWSCPAERGELSRALDCRLRLTPTPPAVDDDRLTSPHVPRAPAVTVRLRNRSGLPQRVPAAYLHREGTRTALLAGIRLRLWRSAPSQRQSEPEAESDPRWEPVRPRTTAAFRATGAGRLLPPAGSLPAFTLNLEEQFDLRQPGLYRLQLEWSRRAGGIADGSSNELRFVLDPEAP